MNKIIQINEVADMNYITEVLDLVMKTIKKKKFNGFWTQVWLWSVINPDESMSIILKHCIWEEAIHMFLIKESCRKNLRTCKKLFDTLYKDVYEERVKLLYENHIQDVIKK